MSQQFIDSIQKMFTWNGALSNATPDKNVASDKVGRMSLFFKTARQITDIQLREYFEKAYNEDIIDTYLIAFHVRDCRGGKGEREIGRKLLRMLADKDINLFTNVVNEIVEYGRWDDLIAILDKKDTQENDTNEQLQKVVFSLLKKQIEKDFEDMKNSRPCSLLAKWMPTEGGKLDCQHKFVAQYCKACRISPILYRKANTTLREYLKIIERYMCTNEWSKIDYSTVPSCAMHKLKKAFLRNDSNRYSEWLEKLKNNDTSVKVNAKQLFPHEIVKEILYANDVADSDAILYRAQWEVLYNETKKLGVFDNVLVLSDVSGSMHGIPMYVSIALGILISSCNEGPFNKKVITFETDPKFLQLESNDIIQNVKTLKKAPWGGSTNFQAVFDLILSTGKESELLDSDMPKIVYVLSDMQFNQADNKFTNYETIKNKYAQSGYTLPKIVFWNLNGSTEDFPCTVDDNGTCMISGFSTSILKSILKYGIVDSYQTMRQTLDDERYIKIKTLLK